MFESLNKLKENDLKIFPYSEIKKVVRALEEYTIYDGIDFMQDTENLETYLSFINILIMRVENDDIKELKTVQTKNLFRKRLRVLNERFGEWWKINSFLRIRSDSINETIMKTTNMINLQQKEVHEKLSDETKKFQEKIDDSEHNILTHVLTLLGVFSAIIVLIMSVVITTNSWLNKAGTDGAIVAIVVPVAIVIVAITVLLSLIYFLYIHKKERNNNPPIVFWICVIGTIAALIILVIRLEYYQNRESQAIHVRYVIEEPNYTIIENKEGEKCYSFRCDGKLEVFPYDENFMHDKKIYYCAKHNALE